MDAGSPLNTQALRAAISAIGTPHGVGQRAEINVGGKTLDVLLEGVGWIYAEVPRGVKEAQLRRIAGLVRARRSSLILRPVQGDLPGGVAFLHLQAREVEWEGTAAGHGRLTVRSISFTASGKATRGMTRRIDLEDNGTDTLRVVSGLAVAPPGRAAG